jgi:sulfur carrier protein
MSVNQIEIILNGFAEKVPEGATISSVIERFEDRDADLIVEHNGRFVYPQAYDATIVSDGDRCEFIHPNFGG